MIKLLFVFPFLLLSFASVDARESFSESLDISPLANGRYFAHFQFDVTHSLKEEPVPTYELFPKTLGELSKRFAFDELHLSFTQGRWMPHWGLITQAAPVGVELWIKFSEEYEDFSRWRSLTHALAGVYCGSLQQMKEQSIVTPEYSFNRFNTSSSPSSSYSSSSIIYGSLPRESVCTENLTPWLKMLPCRVKSGLGSLLSALHLYNVDYHSMQTHITKECQGKDCVLHLRESLDIVIDINKREKREGVQWDLSSLFMRASIDSPCPLASTSKITVHKCHSSDSDPCEYNLLSVSYPFFLKHNPSSALSLSSPPCDDMIDVQRYFSGYGQERGGLVLHIHNQATSPVHVSYLDVLPWYLQLRFHTMQVKLNETELNYRKVFSAFRFEPGEDHGRPNVLEFMSVIPPSSSLSVSLSFNKAFLHWTEHPPDANRGFDIPSAVLSIMQPSHVPYLSPSSTSHPYALRIYTDPLLVTLPTPDFSMPYNVITLTGCIYALFFGSMVNVLVRHITPSDLDQSVISNRPIARLLRTLIKIIDRE